MKTYLIVVAIVFLWAMGYQYIVPDVVNGTTNNFVPLFSALLWAIVYLLCQIYDKLKKMEGSNETK